MKTKLFLLFFLLFCSSVNAEEPSNLNKITDNFEKSCYEYSWKINVSALKDNLLNWKNMSYKVSLNSYEDLKIIQNDSLLPHKVLWNEKTYINYKNDFDINQVESNDNNKNTYISLDTLNEKEVIYELEKPIIANTFQFNIDYESNQSYIDLYISTDWKQFSKVWKTNISDFDLKFIKLKIECSKDMCIREKIKIKELNFIEDRQLIVLNSFYDKDIEFFTKYNCDDSKYTSDAKYYDDYSISNKTQIINLDLNKNPDYNVYFTKDYDKDEIDDNKDNCPLVYNPEQIDTDASGQWDACSDKDRDWKIWEKDNCPTIYNPKQEDSDKNWIGDLCEIDTDLDQVFDSIDNCLTISNPNQEDDDNDTIWNACDNCKIKYNTDQSDVDKDKIWDLCDETDNRYMESNKWFFIGLIVVITIIFGAGIFFIIRKLK